MPYLSTSSTPPKFLTAAGATVLEDVLRRSEQRVLALEQQIIALNVELEQERKDRRVAEKKYTRMLERIIIKQPSLVDLFDTSE